MSELYMRVLVIVSLALIAGCGSSGETKRSVNTNNNDRSRVEVDNSSIPLSDYLRRVAGISVQGSGNNVKVTIRGMRSFRGSNEPLYVIDGQRVGREYYQVASLIPVVDIDHIRVLKGAEAAVYGVEGSNGIIEIFTRKN